MLFKAINSSIVVLFTALTAGCTRTPDTTVGAIHATGAASSASQPAVIVKIGHVGAISGAGANLGKDNENGARLAIEDLNAAGVVIGGRKITFELMAEDDAGDPKQGTAVAQKLVDLGVSGVIGHLNSGTSIPAARIYHEAGIPQISPSATNPKLTRQGFKTTFRLVADDTQLGGALGRYAVTSLHGKTFAVIDDRTAYGQGVAEEFTKAAVAAGGKVIDRHFTNDKATDFNAILTTIKGKKPDVLFFGGMYAQAGPMIKQMRSLRLKAKFVGGDGICSDSLVHFAGSAAGDDQVFCAEAGGVEGEDQISLDAFKARFKSRFNSEVQTYSPYVYDSLRIMAAAMVKAQSSDPAHYLPVLAATTNYQGVTGKISFDEKGDVKNGVLTLKTVRAGKLIPLAVIR